MEGIGIMDIEKVLSELTLEEKAGLCSGRDYWHTKAVERLGIHSVMMCDGPNGLRKQEGEGDHLGIKESIKTVCYPTSSALAASFDRQVLKTIGSALGEECQAEQVGMLLGPGINMKRSPLCGRNFEYFSEDPYLAGELASAYVESLQEQGVAACVKHFAVNNQETRRMSGSSNLDERTLHEIYLPAFEAVVKKGKTRGIMCAYNAVNNTFCSENPQLLTEILRKDWGYEGMVVTDWGAVKDRVKGLEAGLDLEMPGGPGVQDADIVKAVQDGTLEESILDEAVRNVLRFVNDSQTQSRPDTEADREKYAEISEKLALQCAVLLKNQQVLPLAKDCRTVMIGEFAQVPRYQGSGSSHINVPFVTGALEEAQKKGLPVTFALGYRSRQDDMDQELLSEAVAKAKEAQAAVIFAGLPDAYETEGSDRESMRLPDSQNRLIEAVAAVQPNTVVVLHGGAPMELPWLPRVAAVLCMYLGGQRVGAAAVKLLYGEENPSGKLAETWPVRLEDTPAYLNFPGENGVVEYHERIYMGYRYYDKKKLPVLFPFGHGLSYTSFAYSELTLDRESMTDQEQLIVTCRIKNTGDRPGREAVQLYVRDAQSSVGRPVRELKGFTKVELMPGEEREVSFELDKRSFAYYEPKIHDWYVESGTFIVEIGASSRDIRLQAQVQVNGTEELPMAYTPNSTIGDLTRSAGGRAFLEQMMKQLSEEPGRENAAEESCRNMGEGSDKAAQSMMFEMPLRSLVTFGKMTKKQLEDLLDRLNG